MSKYKVGQKFKCNIKDLVYTILNVSLDVDYQGEHSYFVEVLENGKNKWYNVIYDGNMEEIDIIN